MGSSRSSSLLCAVAIALQLNACSHIKPPSPLEAPAEAARHRAALATIVVLNETTSDLSIAFRTAPAGVQEVVIGTARVGERSRLAPVPAGEPIILIARKNDGSELALKARSFPLDAEWLWEIPRAASFTTPAGK